MRKEFQILAVVLLIAPIVMASPRFGSETPSFRDYIGGGASLGLIDPSRVTFDHSIQMGFSGSGNNSLMQSLYASTAHYRVSDPVTLSFTLGMMGTRYSGSGAPAISNDFVGGVALDYRPSRNFHFRVKIVRSPQYYGLDPYSGFNALNNSTGLFPGSDFTR